MSTTDAWQYVYIASLLALLATLSFFSVAVARLADVKPPVQRPPNFDPMKDITFLLLLSSTLYTLLNNCLEIQKLALHRSNRDFVKTYTLSILLLVVAVVLAIAAPAAYGSADGKSRWWSINPVILSFVSNILSVLANVLGVLMVGVANRTKMSFRDLMPLQRRVRGP